MICPQFNVLALYAFRSKGNSKKVNHLTPPNLIKTLLGVQQNEDIPHGLR